VALFVGVVAAGTLVTAISLAAPAAHATVPQQYAVPKKIQGVVLTLRKKEVVMNAIQGLVQEGHVSQHHRVLGECAKNRNRPFFFLFG